MILDELIHPPIPSFPVIFVTNRNDSFPDPEILQRTPSLARDKRGLCIRGAEGRQRVEERRMTLGVSDVSQDSGREYEAREA